MTEIGIEEELRLALRGVNLQLRAASQQAEAQRPSSETLFVQRDAAGRLLLADLLIAKANLVVAISKLEREQVGRGGQTWSTRSAARQMPREMPVEIITEPRTPAASPPGMRELEHLATVSVESLAGFLFYAPAGATPPVARVEGSKFIDAWPTTWIPLDTGLLPAPLPLVYMTRYERVVSDRTIITAFNRPLLDWPEVAEWPQTACMIGWESHDSSIRIIGQSAIDEKTLAQCVRARQHPRYGEEPDDEDRT